MAASASETLLSAAPTTAETPWGRNWFWVRSIAANTEFWKVCNESRTPYRTWTSGRMSSKMPSFLLLISLTAKIKPEWGEFIMGGCSNEQDKHNKLWHKRYKNCIMKSTCLTHDTNGIDGTTGSKKWKDPSDIKIRGRLLLSEHHGHQNKAEHHEDNCWRRCFFHCCRVRSFAWWKFLFFSPFCSYLSFLVAFVLGDLFDGGDFEHTCRSEVGQILAGGRSWSGGSNILTFF